MKLPEYQCHKRVRAAKIADILTLGPPTHFGNATVAAKLSFRIDGDQFHVLVTREWMSKHQPQKGGYYVEYDDGYTSYSPAAAFEGGYSPIAV